MITITVFEDLRLKMDFFGYQWSEWQAIIEHPKSSKKQRKSAKDLMLVVSRMIGKEMFDEGYDRLVTGKFEFVYVGGNDEKRQIKCNPLPCHVH